MSFRLLFNAKKPICITIFLFLFFFFSLSFADKNYTIESVKIDAQINSNGSMDIKETRTYIFKGNFHWASYQLPLEKTGGLLNFKVEEKGRPYLLSESESEGTYNYSQSPEFFQAKWFFDAQNETKTFVLSFRVLDVIKVYDDAAVLYYKFVGTGWDRPSKNVEVTIHPPQPILKEEVKAWAHGPLWGLLEILDSGTVKTYVSGLPPKTFWEVRALYPPELFYEVKEKINQSQDAYTQIVSSIMREEAKWAEEANKKREERIKKIEGKKARKKFGKWGVIVISGIFFLGWWSLYDRYGKKHKVPFPDTMYSELPSEIPPALLSYLLHERQIGGTALVSTILDLARRGFLKINERMEEKKSIFGKSKKHLYSLELQRDFHSKNKNQIADFEENLLTFIFDNLAEGKDRIDFKTLTKKRAKFIEWFREWSKKLSKLGEAKGYYEKDSLKARNISFCLLIPLIAVTVISTIFFEEWAVVSGAMAILIFILSFIIPRRNPEAELEVKKWKALKKYLQKYNFLKERRDSFIENVSSYLVYGVVLGLASKIIKRMVEMVPEEKQAQVWYWYGYYGGHGEFAPSGLGDAISSLVTQATSTMSSASGTGGGASGGGGGGAGGSGGGTG
jgi:uncharacterized membrane protein